MELRNEKYTVLSKVEVNPPLNHFDIVHNTENINTDDFYMTRTFQIKRYDGGVITIALVDLICSGYEPNAVLEENILTIILFRAIVRINLDTGLIVQRTECDNIGGLHEIHPIDNGYIIWGEGEISRYDLNLNQVWWFAGRDILVSLKMDKHFWIDDGLIHCRDFAGWHYVLDMNGKLINDFPEAIDNEIP